MKKIIAMALCFLLATSWLTIRVTAVTDNQRYAGEQLRIIGLLRGYPNGTLGLENPIKRAEVAALLVRTLGYSDKPVEGQGKKFSDVEDSSWAKEDIQKAYRLRLIVGDPGGTFRPSANISYAEIITILVNALGYNKEIEGSWPSNYIARAKDIGLIQDTYVDTKRIVTRGEVSDLLWNTILTKMPMY